MTKAEENKDRLDKFLKLPQEDYKSIIRSVRPEWMSYDDYKDHMKIYKLLTKGMLKGKWRPFGHKESPEQNT